MASTAISLLLKPASASNPTPATSFRPRIRNYIYFAAASRSPSTSPLTLSLPLPSSQALALRQLYFHRHIYPLKACVTETADLRPEQSLPPPQTRRIILWWVLVLSPLVLLLTLCAGNAAAATAAAAAQDSIRASKIGLNVARALRKTGLADEAIVFALATLPVLELRGAIPVGYWMQLNPLLLTAVAILGNMVPVPFIVLYLKAFAWFLSRTNPAANWVVKGLFQRAKEKAGPVKEFQWLGLMLFVAVPFPGTGAWSGAIIASVIDMPFWSAVSANFFGVVLAGLLVNLLVNLGIKYAVATGLVLFFLSTVMWSVLRRFKKDPTS